VEGGGRDAGVHGISYYGLKEMGYKLRNVQKKSQGRGGALEEHHSVSKVAVSPGPQRDKEVPFSVHNV